MTKKKESSKPKVEFDLHMLDNINMYDDEKSNAKMQKRKMEKSAIGMTPQPHLEK